MCAVSEADRLGGAGGCLEQAEWTLTAGSGGGGGVMEQAELPVHAGPGGSDDDRLLP